ncbi:uncharacterized protein LOC141595125 [Silene latifolia]|uniref:uncharacterized protein LOC141595125 n=1 Tax=Silene latifolia TaxID=37657 RepID=UPI003D780D50
MYTVRNAYKLLAGDVGDMASSSDWERGKWLWNRIWKVSLWPRVKLFFWQMCSEALATKANIAARIRGECSSYLFCSYFIESSLHLFRDCGVAKWVWEELGIEYGTEGEGGDIRDLVEQVWKEMSATECGTFMVGCWAIWEHRNKVTFDEARVDPKGVVRRVRDVLHEGIGIEVHTIAGRRRRVKEGEGVGTGIVCRDGRGEVAWGLSVVRDESWEVHEAEAMAVLDGLEDAARRGVPKVEVESDSVYPSL